LLKDIKKSGDTHILLDCKLESIFEVLKQALQVFTLFQWLFHKQKSKKIMTGWSDVISAQFHYHKFGLASG